MLVQALAERWWDTTHTFHIAEKEMTITPYDFYQMTRLWASDPTISLEGELGTTFSVELLRLTYSSKHVWYYELAVDFLSHSQETQGDITHMVRAFLLYMVGLILFANGGQTISLRWLALFRLFEDARKMNLGHACPAYLYSTMDSMSQGSLRQHVGPWKLWVVRSLFFSALSFIIVLITYLANFISCPCNYSISCILNCLLGLQTILSVLASILYLGFSLANYSWLVSNIVAYSSKLFPTCKLNLCHLCLCLVCHALKTVSRSSLFSSNCIHALFLQTVPNLQTVHNLQTICVLVFCSQFHFSCRHKLVLMLSSLLECGEFKDY